MTNTVERFSIVAVVLVLLAGCSHISGEPPAGQGNVEHSADNFKAESSAIPEQCSPEPGSPFHYRKGLLIAGTIAVPDLARDLPGLAVLTSERLEAHLDALDRFTVLATHDTSFESTALGTAARVRQLGRQYSSQFVVKLELQDLTMQSTGGWLSELLGEGNERSVRIKLYIHDTESGALFDSQQYQGTVNGDVMGYPGNGRTVTASWFDTDLGARVDEMLKAMSTRINGKLACVPFSTVVSAIEGNDLHINAGFLQGIRPGTTLRVYRRNSVLLPDGTQQQGMLKQADNEGWVSVNAVFPNHSIAAVIQNGVVGRYPDIGDVVRAW